MSDLPTPEATAAQFVRENSSVSGYEFEIGELIRAERTAAEARGYARGLEEAAQTAEDEADSWETMEDCAGDEGPEGPPPPAALSDCCRDIATEIRALKPGATQAPALAATGQPPVAAQPAVLEIVSEAREGLAGTRCVCGHLLIDRAPLWPAPGACGHCVGGRAALVETDHWLAIHGGEPGKDRGGPAEGDAHVAAGLAPRTEAAVPIHHARSAPAGEGAAPGVAARITGEHQHPETCPVPGQHTRTSCNYFRAELAKYGRHMAGCTLAPPNCSCGLLQALDARPLASTSLVVPR